MNTIAKTLPDLHNDYTRELSDALGDYSDKTEREQFLLGRMFGLGGSDVGAILGANKYKTAVDVWAEKCYFGNAEWALDAGDGTSDAAHFGIVLEDAVAQEYVRRTGNKVQRRNNVIIPPEYPWMGANIDRHVVASDRGLECKTADKWFARSDEWGVGNTYQHNEDGSIELVETDDTVPDSYLLQCMHYMICTKKRVWDLAVLIGGNEFRVFTINYDDGVAQIIIDACRDFWFSNVINGVAPPVTRLSDLSTLYAKDNGEAVTASEEVVDAYRKLEHIKAQIKALEIEAYGPIVATKRIGGLDLIIKKYFEDNTTILLDDKGDKLCTYKAQTRKSLDSAALKKAHPKLVKEFETSSTFRVLR